MRTRVPVHTLNMGDNFAIIDTKGGLGHTFCILEQEHKRRFLRLWDKTYADEFFTGENKDTLVIQIHRATAEHLARKYKDALEKEQGSSQHWMAHKGTTHKMFFGPEDKDKKEYSRNTDKDGLDREQRKIIEEIKQNKSNPLDADLKEVWDE